MSMVETKRCRVNGRIPPCLVTKRRTRNPFYARSGNRMFGNDKIEDFTIYAQPDEDKEADDMFVDHASVNGIDAETLNNQFRSQNVFSKKYTPVSHNLADFLLSRSNGWQKTEYSRVSPEYGTRHILTTGMLKEYPIFLPPQSTPVTNDIHPVSTTIVDKVFCCQWLSHTQIMMGTRCHKLKIYDTNTHKVSDVPLIQLPDEPEPTMNQAIYSLKMNPSRTLLATCDQSAKNIAVYKLPDLSAHCVGQKSHQNALMDVCWLDDELVVSGGYDKKLVLWRAEDYRYSPDEPCPVISPLRMKRCNGADKVRCVVFNSSRRELVTLSTNAFLHLWDTERFYQTTSRKLPHAMENVCLTKKEDDSIYCVGSKSHFTLIDSRTLNYVKKVNARINSCGVRSVSFNNDVLTIGTAVGAILFYDMRAGKYMESTMNSGRAVMLKCSKGYVHAEDNANENSPNGEYSPTIYCHSYDHSGTRLFAGGGPLQGVARGHYGAIWQ